MGLVGDRYRDHYLIEADRGTEGPNVLRKKLDLYRLLFQTGVEQEALGVFPRVLFVTLDNHRGTQIAGHIQKQPEDFRPIFAVTHLSALPGVLAWGPENEADRHV